jgi:hypothetical protein
MKKEEKAVADPRLIFDLDPRHAHEAAELSKLLLRRRAYRIVTDMLDEEARDCLRQSGIAIMHPDDLLEDAPELPAGPTAVLCSRPGFVADLARRAGELPILKLA